jgi:Sec-independent protein secretion pathway component TatC
MIIAMAPLLVLFELSVLLARIFERRRAKAAPDERWDLDDDLSLS